MLAVPVLGDGGPKYAPPGDFVGEVAIRNHDMQAASGIVVTADVLQQGQDLGHGGLRWAHADIPCADLAILSSSSLNSGGVRDATVCFNRDRALPLLIRLPHHETKKEHLASCT